MFDLLTGWLGERPQVTIDKHLDGLSRDSLRSWFRTELLRIPRDKAQDLSAELCRASEREGRLYELFLQHSTNTSLPESRVWTNSEFKSFLHTRLHNDDLTAKVAPILWRCFSFTATYPFIDAAIPPERRTVDLNGWIQAIILLVTDTMGQVGQDWVRWGAKFGISQEGRSALRRSSHRLHFVRFAEDSSSFIGSDASPSGRSPEQHEIDIQEALSEVAKVARASIPLPRKDNTPSLKDLRPKVQRLLAGLAPATSAATIPYGDFKALLETIMHIQYAENEEDSPTLSPGTSSGTEDAIARAILNASGVSRDRALTVEDYLTFVSKQHSSFTLDDQVAAMWQTLFADETTQGNNSKSSEEHPPPHVLRALEFLLPFPQPLIWIQQRRQSVRSCTTTLSDGLSHADVLRALTSSFGPKLVILYGVAESPSSDSLAIEYAGAENQPVVFVVLIPTPLPSTNGSRSAATDFLVGDDHLLMALAPQARILRVIPTHPRITDLVDTPHNRIFFGDSRENPGVSYVPGLDIDFDTGVATLRSRSAPKEESRSSYVEVNTGVINMGNYSRSAEETPNAQPWEIVARIQKLEVYNLPDGIPSDLIINENGENGDSENGLSSEGNP